MTELQYTLTESQFIAAQRLHVSLRSPAQRLMRWLTLLLGMALVVGSLYEGLYWLTAGGLIAILSPWLSWTFTTQPRLMQAYRSSPALHQLNRLALREDLLYSGDGQNQNALQWNHIIRWAENDHSLLLYLQPQLFIIVPKSAQAPDGFFTALREQLMSHVGPTVS